METISQGIAYPYAIAIDGKNDLWVANGGTNAVTEYAPGSQAPSLTLTHGVSQPMALTFDSAGNLYVANCNQCITPSAPDTVTVYSPSGKLLRTISEDITSPKSLAVDPYKTLLVANYSTLYVSYYKNGKAKLSGKITDDIANPTALIVDSEGNVYVASQNSIIAIFSPKTFALEAKIGQGLDQPGGLALSPSNDIYAANVAGNSVTGYSWSGSSSKLLYTITKGIKVPSAVAFGP
jgi:sugar lactone lactonase YvrE